MRRRTLLSILALACASASVHAATEAPRDESLHDLVAALGGKPGLIELEAKTYHLTRTLDLSTGQSLVGKRGYSILQWEGIAGQPVIKISGRQGKRIGSATYLPGQKFPQIETSSKPGTRVRVRTADREDWFPRLESNVVVAGPAGPQLRRRTIFAYSGEVALYVFNPTLDVILENLTVDGAGKASAGIFIQNAERITVDTCTIRNANFGIYVKESHEVSIRGNRIQESILGGIRIERSSIGEIESNTLLDSLNTAIFCGNGCWLYKIDSNRILGTGVIGSGGVPGGGDGITLVGAGDLTITNNQILAADCYGIWAAREVTNTIVSGNVIKGGVTAGIFYNGTPASNASTQLSVILGNLIDNNAGGQIALSPPRNIIVDNNILGPQVESLRSNLEAGSHIGTNLRTDVVNTRHPADQTP